MLLIRARMLAFRHHHQRFQWLVSKACQIRPWPLRWITTARIASRPRLLFHLLKSQHWHHPLSQLRQFPTGQFPRRPLACLRCHQATLVTNFVVELEKIATSMFSMHHPVACPIRTISPIFFLDYLNGHFIHWVHSVQNLLFYPVLQSPIERLVIQAFAESC